METTQAPTKTEKTAEEGRRLTDEEWDYIQHRVSMQWRVIVSAGIFFLVFSTGFGLLARWLGDEGFHIMGAISILSLTIGIVLIGTSLPRLLRLRPGREGDSVKKSQIRIFPLPLVWFQPNRGCEVRSAETVVPPHWSRFFNHLRPINGDGSLDIEAEIYETSEEDYVLALSNGLSVDKEMPLGLLDTLALRHLRGLTWYFFNGLSVVFTILTLNEALRIVPMTRSYGEFVDMLLVPTGFVFAFLVALGVPAIYFWRQHKHALARIEAMYEAESLPERGHERNVGASNGGNTSNARERHGPSS